MKVKVCGLIDKEQIKELMDFGVNFVGLNFYQPSPRYYSGENLDYLQNNITHKTGIFVNANDEYVVRQIKNHGLTYVQLHGKESPAYCMMLSEHAKVIKAFPHYEIENIEELNKYRSVDLFLFDTATEKYGGSGKKFDWEILNNFNSPKPFLLAGGISFEDVEKVRSIKKIPGFIGVDINSKFEKKPGIKDISKIKRFINYLK